MPPSSRFLRRACGALAGAALLGAGPIAAPPAGAAPSELFFSEYVEGSSNNKALEIYNGTGSPVDLAASGYSVFMSFNGGSTTRTIPLTGTVAASDVFVLANPSAVEAITNQADQLDTSTTWYNGDDAVQLRKGATAVDTIGQLSPDPGTEWGTGLASTADNTLRRKSSVETGDTNPTDAFDPAAEWDGFAIDTFDGLGSHGPPPDDAPVATTCPSDTRVMEGTERTMTASATDADDAVTTFETTVDPATSAINQSSSTPAPADGGTGTATITIDGTAELGMYTVTVKATNDDVVNPQSDDCTFTVTVQEVLEIGEVQGVVEDTDDGATHASPYAGQFVFVRGVVAQKTLSKTASGSDKGFFLQDVDGDGDDHTSDGIFVYQSRFNDLIGGYVPQVGDEIVISASVTEFFNLTELTSARLQGDVVDTGVTVGRVEVDPPDDAEEAERYWERLEGMQAQVPANSVAVDGRDVFPSTMDGEVWVIRGDHPVAQRQDPYARRVFRDPHPMDNVAGEAWDDGNGYRIMMGSLGLKGATGNVDELIAPVRTYDTITNPPAGGVYYSFGKYSVQVAEQLVFERGVDPAGNAPPQEPDRTSEYSVSTYNVENLYDYRDDPNDGCDFADDAGCPGVRPPFDYVPASDEAYQARLDEMAAQIVDALHAPDLLLIQEAEDQDICTVESGALTCGVTDNADGKPDTLQELALNIAEADGPAYDAAYDRDGSDDRGIVSAFLFRRDRVELLPATAGDPVLGSSPEVEYRGEALSYNHDVQNPKALNAALPDDVDRSTGTDGDDVFTRDPQVGHFRIWRGDVGASVFTDIYAVSNHFSSTPDARVGQRTEQAAYNAAIAHALHEAGEERVLIGGDFNVYPRPDDAFRPGHPQFGADQLGPLYEAGLHNLWDVLVAEVPVSAYSYVFQGQTQTLDQIFVSRVLLEELVQFRAAHVNADFPADFEGDGTRGLSDHDPQVARFVAGVTVDQLEALVRYYVAAGDIRNGKEDQLLAHLDKARRFAEQGKTDAYEAQIQAFANQARGLAPKHIDPEAAEALAAEAELLLALT